MSLTRTIARRMQREKYGTNNPRKLGRRVSKSFTLAPEPPPESVTHSPAPARPILADPRPRIVASETPSALSQSPKRDKAEDPVHESMEVATAPPSRRKMRPATFLAAASIIAGPDVFAAAESLSQEPAPKPRKPRAKKTAE